MAKLNKTRTIAAALLGTAVLGAPITSFAQDFRTTSNSYSECKTADRNNQVVGGLIGAVAGGVFGSQVSGNGARTEGSIIGAALGAAAGAGIADGSRNCSTEARRVQTGFNSNVPRTIGTTRVATNRIVTTGVNNRGFNNRGFNNRSVGTQTVSYRNNSRRVEQRLYEIERDIKTANIKIEKLEYEERLLKKKLRNARNTRQIRFRLKEIDDKICYLKDEKRDLKREANKITSRRY
ncbi:MAG: glycine zipper 2TM domain-containing protein [Maricaulaceae bacterium]